MRTIGTRLVLSGAGSWTAGRARELEKLVDAALRRRDADEIAAIDMARVERIDTYGAWLLERLVRGASRPGHQPQVTGLSERYLALIEEARQSNRAPAPRRRDGAILSGLALIGRTVVGILVDLVDLLHMIGAVFVAVGRVLLVRPWTFRLTSMVHHLDRVGWRAVPVIVLITFLLGAIIAQQGIFHFSRLNADLFVVDMLGILVLREIGVLMVCVMVAGRSGSAYTAELGSMKMREEIDALRTMGFDPVDVLILPRIAALVIAVPILTFLGAMAALYGGGLVFWLYGGMPPEIFLGRLREAVTLDHFAIGLVKAPFMALVIGIVASVEGLAVAGSAESLGVRTTASVVKSIFLVIALDGLFAIFFAAIGR
ncbi:MAG: ABC transporter permease [Hyphomicrobiales bacterium]|nr:ABC transporter permease [Hyphomicrobiales bacterium]